jgi:DNA-binding response OmpR family regulator
MRVLVVEDETLSAFSLTAELEQAGHRVIGPARSSGEAIVLARSRIPSVALVDIDLECEGAGIRLAQQLCTEFDMPVIFMTEHKTTARDNASYAIGMITKPFDCAMIPDILRYADEHVRKGSSPSVGACSFSFELFDRKRD